MTQFTIIFQGLKAGVDECVNALYQFAADKYQHVVKRYKPVAQKKTTTLVTPLCHPPPHVRPLRSVMRLSDVRWQC